MFEPLSLSEDQIHRCEQTISSNTFYMLVSDALVSSKSLSVVRMGDGERQLIDNIRTGGIHDPLAIHEANIEETQTWLTRMGCLGISKHELSRRLEAAANECTYFAPSISGIQKECYNLYDSFRPRDKYVDNFFCNAWTEEMKIQLFKTAGHVLFIHRNVVSADAMQIRAKYALDVKVTYLQLETWQQTEEIIERGSKIPASLVLFSAGPASKYLGARISQQGIPKVTLDIGNASDYWLLDSLKHIPNGRR